MKRIVNGIITGIMFFVILICMITVFASGSLLGNYVFSRNHWNVTTEENEFTESARELHNPNRGFYSLYGFVISDEEQDYCRQLELKMCEDSCALSLIQVNLREYRERALTKEGLANIDALFGALEAKDKQYIVRFLYDWNGKAEETEPENVQTILGHMSQLEEILEKYRHIIFLLQGIFVGDCGEMHGSTHMSEESMNLLMQQLYRVTPENIFLSVRTPQHWRIITGITEAGQITVGSLAERMGLYNDGMMGTWLDAGTYGTKTKEEAGVTGKWTRGEELDFQEALCRLVPNGGEVINESGINDLERAIENLSAMHVTYLSGAHDGKVLEKWKNSIVTEKGSFYGMDGLSYIERHLGYRFLINEVGIKYDFWTDKLNLVVALKNVGFAPVYKEPEVYFVFRHKDTKMLRVHPVKADISSLCGGNSSEELLFIQKDISLKGMNAGEYEVFFYLWDKDSGRMIEFANEEPIQEYGYLLGTFVVDDWKNPLAVKNGKEGE